MSIDFSAADDLFDTVDGLEAVTLRHRESGESLPVPAALRRETVIREAEPSGGTATQADLDWFLPLFTGEPQPQLGDVIVDSTGATWTILAIEDQPLLGRQKCATRELRVAFGCGDFVDVQRAVWDDLGEGPVIVGWNDVYTAMPVRIQPDTTEVSDTSNAPTSTKRFTIILGEHFPLEADDRFVGPDGAIYRLESIEQTEHIDRLPIAKVIKVSS